MMEPKFHITIMSPDGVRRWTGDVPGSQIPRSEEYLEVRAAFYPDEVDFSGLVSKVGWTWHNGVAAVTVQLMDVPEEHVTKQRSSGLDMLPVKVNIPTDEIERLKAEVEAAELRLARGNPLKRDRIQEGVDKARELASSDPVMELEVLLLTDPYLDEVARALLRRVIRALKESKCYG